MTKARITQCFALTLIVLHVVSFVTLVYAGCGRSITQTTFADYNGTIHTTDGNYYRGEIHTFDRSVGICTVTAYISFRAGGLPSVNTYSLNLYAVNDSDNMTTLLGTSDNTYHGGNWTLQGEDNWTRTRKVFHFYHPVKVPAGRVAIVIHDNNSTAHPNNYHAWNRSVAVEGSKACSWTPTKGGNCTDEYSQMMEIGYVHTPYLTAEPNCYMPKVGAPPYYCSKPQSPHAGWLYIPSWKSYGADWCIMDDNITVACELPEGIPDGTKRIRARFCPPDQNETRCSSYSSMIYRLTRHGGDGGVTNYDNATITSHFAGENTSTITGIHR